MTLYWLLISCKPVPTGPAELNTYGGKEYQSFTDFPPYFVELVNTTPSKNTITSDSHNSHEISHQPTEIDNSSQKISESEIKGTCSAAHIGGGYILTAAHCLMLLCSDSSHTFKYFGVRYLTRSKTGQLEDKILTRDKIESIAIHKKFFAFSADSNVYGQHANHDIALIKVRTNALEPFAGTATLPTTDQYNTQNLDGVLYQHGIGRELSHRHNNLVGIPPEVSHALGIGIVYPKRGSQNSPSSPLGTRVSSSYFGGSVRVVTNDPQFLEFRGQSLKKIKADMILDVTQWLKNERDSPEKQKYVTQNHEMPNNCGLTPSSSQELSFSHFLFSRDNKYYRYSEESDLGVIINTFITELQERKSSGKATLSDEEVKKYADKFVRANIAGSIFHVPVGEEDTINKWLTVTTSGPENDKDRVLKACKGDSGGPLVKSVSTRSIHVATAATLLQLIDIEGKLLAYKYSKCNTYLQSVNTFAHLGWIAAAKASMAAGKHSYQDYYQKLIKKNDDLLPTPDPPPERLNTLN
ncbi:MAG: trypsin-like serine protease [Proteobacteria bacterium]|nr:trypsin-like serine protease [Pseudomonadota bacterium]